MSLALRRETKRYVAALPPRANVYSQSNARGIRPPGQHILSRDSFPSFRRHQSPFKNNSAAKVAGRQDLYQRAQILTTQFSSSLKSINHDSTNEPAESLGSGERDVSDQ